MYSNSAMCEIYIFYLNSLRNLKRWLFLISSLIDEETESNNLGNLIKDKQQINRRTRNFTWVFLILKSMFKHSIMTYTIKYVLVINFYWLICYKYYLSFSQISNIFLHVTFYTQFCYILLVLQTKEDWRDPETCGSFLQMTNDCICSHWHTTGLI